MSRNACENRRNGNDFHSGHRKQNSDLLNSTHLLYLISADSHIHFMSYFCNIKGQTRQARWLLTNLTFYNQISGFFLLLQYVSNQDLIYLVFILNPFLKMNSISSFDFTTTF